MSHAPIALIAYANDIRFSARILGNFWIFYSHSIRDSDRSLIHARWQSMTSGSLEEVINALRPPDGLRCVEFLFLFIVVQIPLIRKLLSPFVSWIHWTAHKCTQPDLSRFLKMETKHKIEATSIYFQSIFNDGRIKTDTPTQIGEKNLFFFARARSRKFEVYLLLLVSTQLISLPSPAFEYSEFRVYSFPFSFVRPFSFVIFVN